MTHSTVKRDSTRSESGQRTSPAQYKPLFYSGYQRSHAAHSKYCRASHLCDTLSSERETNLTSKSRKGFCIGVKQYAPACNAAFHFDQNRLRRSR
jgi:hypothetical protein